jgi:hypothetical protein
MALEEQPPGPFFEVIETRGGKKEKRLYVPPESPPPKPEIPRSEAREGSQLWHAWEEYDIYQAYLAHLQEEADFVDRYQERVKIHILAECPANGSDPNRIINPGDWNKVRWAAFSAHVQQEDLAAVLRQSFRGEV